MSLIIQMLKENVGVVNTTKDLIYKESLVDIHNIKGSYIKLEVDDKMLGSDITFGNQKLYLSGMEKDAKKLKKTFRIHSALTKKVLSSNGVSGGVEKVILSEIFNSL